MRKIVLVLSVILVLAFAFGATGAEKFPVNNASFENNEIGTRFIGEITNNSGKNYEQAVFKLSVYDASGKLLDVLQFVMNGFRNGDTDTFEAISMKVLPSPDISKLRVKFEMGM